MNVYGTKQIRNVVLLGHGGAGKTTVAEALALVTGVTKRMGKVVDGNTISDYDKEEIKRQFSISTSLIPIEYQGDEGMMKINILDTPGYFDFVGEVEEAVSVADAAIIVVNCKAGIEVGTEKAWELCDKLKLPRVIFVTNMDDDHASFRELVLKLERRFGRSIAPFQLPIRENEKFVGYVNVVKMAGRRFTNLSDYEECEIPDYSQKNLGIAKNMLAGRLKMLVDEGILHLQPASDGSAWQEYVLTDKGRALQTVLVALSQWADDYLLDPDEPATRLIDRQQRQPLRKLVLHAADGRELSPADITIALPLND